jgi:predicted nucleic acid-binding protein
MILRVFLDSDVLLDVVLERGEFSESALKIFALQDEGRVELYTSALSLANIAYFSRKYGKSPFLIVAALLKWIKVISLERIHFEQTIKSAFKDFEDGLQYFSSLEIDGLDAIVTRNLKDFKGVSVPTFTPDKFLASILP